MWQRLQETGTVHPPLYFLLLRSLIAIAGDEPLTMRLLSVLAGSFLVPAAYWLTYICLSGRVNHGERLLVDNQAGIGILAALLVAINPLQIHLACQARGYALAALLLALAAVALLRQLHGANQTWRGWVTYTLLTLAAWSPTTWQCWAQWHNGSMLALLSSCFFVALPHTQQSRIIRGP